MFPRIPAREEGEEEEEEQSIQRRSVHVLNTPPAVRPRKKLKLAAMVDASEVSMVPPKTPPNHRVIENDHLTKMGRARTPYV